MYMQFFVKKKGDGIEIIKQSAFPLFNINIYADHLHLGSISYMESLYIKLPYKNVQSIHIFADALDKGQYFKVSERHDLMDHSLYREPAGRIEFKPGDILVGCDNVNGLPFGYMGHAAIVVDSHSAVEATPLKPIIRKIPISRFRKNHSLHTVIRPKSEELGRKAAQFAVNYLEAFNTGKNVPTFKFTLSEPLYEDQYIYCSKLVWLSYYYGGNYEFPNDHLWFAPEDLYSMTKNNQDFKTVYIHPEFHFKLDL